MQGLQPGMASDQLARACAQYPLPGVGIPRRAQCFLTATSDTPRAEAISRTGCSQTSLASLSSPRPVRLLLPEGCTRLATARIGTDRKPTGRDPEGLAALRAGSGYPLVLPWLRVIP